MSSLAATADTRITGASIVHESLIVALADGLVISAPLAWFPRLLEADAQARTRFEISGAGYGLHWPDLEADISSEGLLRGAPSAEQR